MVLRIVPTKHTTYTEKQHQITDEVTVSYYSNANVIQSVTGINGNIADPSVKSFYNAYDTQPHRQTITGEC